MLFITNREPNGSIKLMSELINMKKAYLLIMPVLVIFTLFGCANKAVSIYDTEEQKLSTSDELRKFHAIVHYPEEIKLNFPGYIIGIEKSPRKDILAKDYKLKLNNKNRSSGILKDIKRLETNPKLLYISHISKYNNNGVNKTFLYNLYEKNKSSISQAYENSWLALDELNKAIKNDSYNMVVVFTMGWNTSQEEAVRNFNSIYRNIKEKSNQQFKPLFIGVTWPSEWESSILPDTLVKLASFPNKSNDADELGLTWLGALLHDTLKDVKKPIVVIGHSFGARASGMAVFEGNAIYKDKPFNKRKIDAFISLQGAYSINRFFDKGIEDILYDKKDTKVILTSSRLDTAMDTAFWGPYVGDDSTYQDYCKDYDSLDCSSYPNKSLMLYESLNNKKILYLDSTAIIKNNVYNSGGDAHSDIYDGEMGILLWEIIKNYKKTSI